MDYRLIDVIGNGWYFEGLDPENHVYYVFLGMKAFPTSYVSIKELDYQNNKRWVEDYFTKFQAKAGNKIDINAKGKWGY